MCSFKGLYCERHQKERCLCNICFFLSCNCGSGIAGTMSMNNADPMMTYQYDIIKYDRNGDPYFFNQKVNYYDRDGNVYQMTDDNACFINTETGEEYAYTNCFIDSKGYFIYLTSEELCEFTGDDIVYSD